MGRMKEVAIDAQDDMFFTARRPPPKGYGPPRDPAIPDEVYDLFERFSIEASRRTDRYSADAILHRIRWFSMIERGDRAFKGNNNWTPILARWFMGKYPSLTGFFELRVLSHERKDKP